jgi:hypothetical protein
MNIDGNLILVLSPIIVGLMQAIKMAGLPSRYAPLGSVVAGVALTGGLSGSEPIRDVILSGIAAGLTASGLYAGTKAMGGDSDGSDGATIINQTVVSNSETEN